MLLIVSNLFSQNKKHSTILFENILLDNHQLFFELNNVTSLEKYLDKLHEKSNVSISKIKIPLASDKIITGKFLNKNIILYTTRDSAFIQYFNFEKSKKNLILNFKKKKITLSNNYKLFQFRKDFPDSFKFAKGINATPLSQAAFIPVRVVRSKFKGYLCFTFYDSKLIDVFLSDTEPETPY